MFGVCSAIAATSVLGLAAVLSAPVPPRWAIAPICLAAGVVAARIDRRSTPAAALTNVALTLELVALGLVRGAPTPRAIEDVARSADTCAADDLRLAIAPLAVVGRLLELGADPEQAWSTLREHTAYRRVSLSAARCANSGAKLAGGLSDAALELRTQLRLHHVERAQRVGIMSLLPLGLCFLPAFICLAIVPMVAGLMSAGLSVGTG